MAAKTRWAAEEREMNAASKRQVMNDEGRMESLTPHVAGHSIIARFMGSFDNSRIAHRGRVGLMIYCSMLFEVPAHCQCVSLFRQSSKWNGLRIASGDMR